MISIELFKTKADDEESSGYIPGETISGSLILQPRIVHSIKNISLSFVGKEKVKLSKPAVSQSSTLFSLFHTLPISKFKKHQSSKSKGGDSKPSKIRFSFTVPHASPPSFAFSSNGNTFNVRYRLKAVVKLSCRCCKKRTATYSHPVVIGSAYDTSPAVQNLQDCPEMKAKCEFPRNVSFPSNVFGIKLSIKSITTSIPYLKLKLKQKIKCMDDKMASHSSISHSLYSNTLITKKIKHAFPLASGRRRKGTICVTLPSDILPSVLPGKNTLFSNTYHLHLQIPIFDKERKEVVGEKSIVFPLLIATQPPIPVIANPTPTVSSPRLVSTQVPTTYATRCCSKKRSSASKLVLYDTRSGRVANVIPFKRNIPSVELMQIESVI